MASNKHAQIRYKVLDDCFEVEAIDDGSGFYYRYSEVA